MENTESVLIVDDDPQMQLALQAALTRGGYKVSCVGDGVQALAFLAENSVDLIISDQRMPEMTGQELLIQLQEQGISTPFIMITAHGTINQAVEAMQLGAADFITKPFDSGDLVRVVERVLSPEAKEFRQNAQKSPDSKRPIVTNDPMMIRVLEVAEAVSRSDATVLIQGESGTGKELIARLIHSSSSRTKQPFVAVNCAALPSNLLESELFGHEKGAFTGADAKKIGKFELAHGGTILLDEISEMELALQAKLLRVLQEREVDRVGGKSPIPIDVRVLATTNRNLEQTVEKGEFRADLFYRLNVIPLTLPPLRERRGDVKLLVDHFMRKYLGSKTVEVQGEVMQRLLNYPWPGNIRELQNAVERAAILSAGSSPSESDFLLGMNGEQKSSLAQQIEVSAYNDGYGSTEAQDDALRIQSGITVHEMERRLILETLRSTDNNRTQAAKLLGISIRTLRNKLNEYKAAEA